MKHDLTLDFCVIGAQKSGTTSLHYYLKTHPSISLPNSKEAPFFSNDNDYVKGVSWYINEYFPGAIGEQLLGTVSPTYMCYPVSIERIYKTFPKIKLIAILRDPIERAESQYKMNVRALGEKRTFEEVVLDQLHSASPLARNQPTETDSYVFFSEYGRILSGYFEFFPPQQILILYSEDLKTSPVETLQKIYNFLGVEVINVTPTEKLYNSTPEAPSKNLTVQLANFVNHKYVRSVGKHLLPENIKRRIRFWSVINRYDSNIKGGIDVSLSESTLKLLVNHYISDLEILEKLLGVKVRWRGRLTKLINQVGVDNDGEAPVID